MKRHEVPVELTWNLQDIYEDMELYEQNVELLKSEANSLENLDIAMMSTNELGDLLKALENYHIREDLLYTYLSLHLSVDMTDTKLQEKENKLMSILSDHAGRLSYIVSELHKLEKEKLEELAKKYPNFKVYIHDLLRERLYRLTDETEKVLGTLRRMADEGQMVVMVTHDLEAAALADRVVVMHDGRTMKTFGHSTSQELLAVMTGLKV